ncbi:MAG: HNH endonuclease [Selenomonadaceae bacterium]|nr:HNH endonuclease [Selenomonadaceae bacterium]
MPTTEFTDQKVNHIDGDKTNNRADNLEWVTPSENNQHAVQTGLMKSGGDNYQAGLTNEQARWCRKVYKPRDKEFGCNALARRFNMNADNMRKVIHGKSYKNVE